MCQADRLTGGGGYCKAWLFAQVGNSCTLGYK